MDDKNNMDSYSENLAVLQPLQLRKALIMAGGFGSRMKELTKDKPKPMLELQGRPILGYSIELCKMHGINDIAISVHYFGHLIKQHFEGGSRFGVRINYVDEKEPLGTAGALRLHRNWLTEPFMMCNADELKDIDIHSMYRQHLRTKAAATIALTRVDDPSQYGVVELEGNKIKKFVEKPRKEEAPSSLINAGLYILNPEVIDLIPDGFCMMEKWVFPLLAQQGRLYGFEFKGQWFDTGTIERYANAERNWKGFSRQNGAGKEK